MRVLIGYDGSAGADEALEDLRRAGLPRHAEALILTVGEPLVAPSSRGIRNAAPPSALGARVEARELALWARDRIRSYFPLWTIRAEDTGGVLPHALIENADAWGADLVVVGSRRRASLGRLLFGSVSQRVAARARSNVRVARSRAGRSGAAPPRILLGVDSSPEAERAVRVVCRRRWPPGTEVRLLALESGHLRAGPAYGIAGALRSVGLRASVAAAEGRPRRVLVEEARRWRADCIFVGAPGPSSALDALVPRDTATAVAMDADCTVEVVRSGSALRGVNAVEKHEHLREPLTPAYRAPRQHAASAGECGRPSGGNTRGECVFTRY